MISARKAWIQPISSPSRKFMKGYSSRWVKRTTTVDSSSPLVRSSEQSSKSLTPKLAKPSTIQPLEPVVSLPRPTNTSKTNSGNQPSPNRWTNSKNPPSSAVKRKNLIYPITLANLVLHGIDEPHIWHGNTLTNNETYGGLFTDAPQLIRRHPNESTLRR